MEIATEKARCETVENQFELAELVSKKSLARRGLERARRHQARLDHLYGDGDAITRRHRQLRPFTTADLDSVMKRTVEIARKIGLAMIPVYVSNLQADFELRSVWQAIDRTMDEAFAKVKRQATTELGNSGETAKKILERAKTKLSRVKDEVYRELQIESHNLRSKIARRTTPNREDRYTKTRIPGVSFMQQAALRDFAARIVEEACRCFDSKCFNATAVLAGSATEAILLDLLRRQDASVIQGATKSREALEKWRLDDLIRTALKLKLLQESTRSLNDFLQNQRNLIHPGRALREKSLTGAGQAQIALGILTHICEDLAQKSSTKSSTSKFHRT